MSAILYDNALVEKLKSWTTKTNIHVYSPDETEQLFSVTADIHDDRPIDLPLLCIRRPGGYFLENSNKKVLTYDGMTLEATIPKSIQLNAIPIRINYQIDIYTRKLSEADEFMRNLVFNIINFPALPIYIPYRDMNIQHLSSIRFIDNQIYDNSSIPERLNFGQFSRLSVAITVDDAYIWDVRVRDNVLIDAQIELN